MQQIWVYAGEPELIGNPVVGLKLGRDFSTRVSRPVILRDTKRREEFRKKAILVSVTSDEGDCVWGEVVRVADCYLTLFREQGFLAGYASDGNNPVFCVVKETASP